MIDVGLYGFDLDVLKTSFNLRALVSIFFDDYAQAVKDFKTLRLIADEEERLDEKMICYENLGRCYQSLKQYDNAVKCHKK
jgi:tetratricopeptide (TPR) repeat protein